MTSRQLILLLLVLIGIGILFTAGKLLLTPPPSTIPSPTGEVTISPTPSPTSSSVATSSFTARIGQKVGMADLSVTPLEVVEDSRCPTNVMCIQAGTVRLRVEIATALATSSQILKLNEAFTVGTKKVTLVDVMPATTAGTQIAPADYRFVLTIK